MQPETEPVVLQTGPETFEVWASGRRLSARVAHTTRRGLGLQGVPPTQVAMELVRFLSERDALPFPDAADHVVDLGRAAGAFPEFTDELRARLT